jgi:hypothetical protein
MEVSRFDDVQVEAVVVLKNPFVIARSPYKD